MTKKEQKEYKDFVKMQMKVLNYNARVELHNQDGEALKKEGDKLRSQLDRFIAKYEKEEGQRDGDSGKSV